MASPQTAQLRHLFATSLSQPIVAAYEGDCGALVGLSPLGLLRTTWQLLHTRTAWKKESSGMACFLLVHFLSKKRVMRGNNKVRQQREDARAENVAAVPAVVLALHEAELNTALIAPESTT